MSILLELESIIGDRKASPREGSYTCHLFAQGIDEIVKKVGEEAIEVIVAATNQSDERVTKESADLIYHLLVLLAQRGVSWASVEAELESRRR